MKLWEFLDFSKNILASFIATKEDALIVHYQINKLAKIWPDCVCHINSQEI